MILGLGIDIVEIQRIEKALQRHGDHFAERILTASEMAHWNDRNKRPSFLAKRWAVKEAVVKALGCGIGKEAAFHDMEISNDDAGRPLVTLSGSALNTYNRLGGKQLLISISDEKHYAVAQAIIDN